MDSKSTIQVHGSASQERDRPDLSAVTTLSQRTDALIRGLRLVARVHKASSEIQDLLEKQVKNYLEDCVSERVWLDRVKYLVALPLARYLRCEEPIAPSPLEFSGPFKRWFQVRIKVFSPRNTHLWYSWFQCKRACLPVSEEMIFSTYKKHLHTLTSPDRGDPTIVEAVWANPTFQSVLEEVRQQVNGEYLPELEDTDHHASLSACYESSRANEGTHGFLRRLTGLNREVLVETWSSSDIEAQAYGRPPQPGPDTTYVPRFSRGTEIVIDRILSSISYFPYIYEKGKKIRNCLVIKTEQLGREQWIGMKEGIRKALPLYEGPLHAMIQAVVEPCKVRVISKGEAVPYHESKRLQRAMHSSLRNMPCFRLIGRTLEDTDVSSISFKSLPSWEWFSIDYSSATDYLSYNYSKRIFDYIIQDLPPEVKSLASKVLGPHHLFYPMDLEARVDEDGTPLKKQEYGHRFWWKTPSYGGLQTSGQLMGSPLSFPILCLANLGVYLSVTENIHESWSEEERLSSVLINGDDMLYAAPRELWEEHVKIGRGVGLEMSLGKAYHHPVYSNINSMGFHYDLRKGKEVGPVRRVPFLNTGLFFLQRKVLGKDGNLAEPDEDPIESLNEILNGCYDSKMECVVLAEYLTAHSLLLKRRTMVSYDTPWKERPFGVKKHRHLTVFFRNLFIHRSLGGMGVRLPDGFRTKIHRSQKRLALALAEPFLGCPTSVFGSGPLIADDLKVVREIENPWSSKRSAEVRKAEDEVAEEALISNLIPRLKRWEDYSEGLKQTTMSCLETGFRFINTCSIKYRVQTERAISSQTQTSEEEFDEESHSSAKGGYKQVGTITYQRLFPIAEEIRSPENPGFTLKDYLYGNKEKIPLTSGSYGVAGSNRPKIGSKSFKKAIRYQKRQKKVPRGITTFDSERDVMYYISKIDQQIFLRRKVESQEDGPQLGPWLAPWDLARSHLRQSLSGLSEPFLSEEYRAQLVRYKLYNSETTLSYCHEQSVPKSLFFGFWA